jgi:hypothetical protein
MNNPGQLYENLVARDIISSGAGRLVLEQV